MLWYARLFLFEIIYVCTFYKVSHPPTPEELVIILLNFYAQLNLLQFSFSKLYKLPWARILTKIRKNQIICHRFKQIYVSIPRRIRIQVVFSLFKYGFDTWSNQQIISICLSLLPLFGLVCMMNYSVARKIRC